jgi:hypothetical protein
MKAWLIGTALGAASLSLGGFQPGAAPAADKPASLGAFERFKALDGTWEGKSTRGWTEQVTYRTIAGGSCVMETSFDAHPNEMMATMVHMDGDRLMLTHYCVAKNQPRLVATGFDDGGQTVTFTFLDATNLPSRDVGHMDKVVFRFVDADHFTSQWTWYQDGKEAWMEEIEHRRTAAQGGPPTIHPAAATPATPKTARFRRNPVLPWRGQPGVRRCTSPPPPHSPSLSGPR